MYCVNCGHQHSPQAKFCTVCGRPVAGNANAVFETANRQTATEVIVRTPLHSNAKKIWLIAIVAVIITVLIVGALVGVMMSSGKPYETIAYRYSLVSSNLEFDEMQEYSLVDVKQFLRDYMTYLRNFTGMDEEEMYEKMEDEYDTTVNDFDDFMDCLEKESREKLEEEYGPYDLTAEIISSEKMSQQELEDAVDQIDDTVSAVGKDASDYFDIEKITEGYCVTIEVCYHGEDETVYENNEYNVVKYRGEWKVLAVATL